MKLNLYLVLAFVATVIFGSLLIEVTRIATSSTMAYQNFYYKPFGLNLFQNEDFERQWRLLDEKINPDILTTSFERNRLIQINQSDKAKIELSGFIIVLILLVKGWLGLRYQRQTKDDLKFLNWFGFFISLIFMRLLILYSFFIYSGSILSDLATPFHMLILPVFITIKIIIVAGLLTAFGILFQLPKSIRLKIILLGVIGGGVGFYLWMAIGPLIFNS